ncbi:MAG TPA: hypothetical protein VFX59_14090 [Polyangiales bacterium]|nr:hypothetical protein [Polyangiales bacterium]
MRVSPLLLLLACSEPAAPPKLAEPVVEKPPKAIVQEPAPAPLRHAKLGAPANGCAIELEQRLGAGTRGVALKDGIVVASDDALTLWQLADAFREGPHIKLDAPVAKASAVCASDCQLAWIDQKMRLFHTRLDGAPAKELARGVDRRFAPALALQGDRTLIAFTTTVDEVMHTKLLGVRGDKLEPTQDVTPEGHGATAPTFLLGASPTLIAIDAHGGISPLLELPLDGTGKPRASLVRTPVSQPFEPPQLAAVQWSSGEAEAFFTVIGKLAMTAIGRVPLRRPETIDALSPSRGYGELSFAVARGPRRTLFAYEVPVASTPKAERKLELALSDGARTDPGPSFEAPALAPSLARTPGGYLLAYTRADQVHGALLRCADE